MLTASNYVLMNEDKKELLKHGTAGFWCNAYHNNVHDYLGEQILPHWHGDLEMFVLDEGLVQVVFADQEYTLQSGEGYFVNTEVLHGIFCATSAPCLYRSLVFDQTVISGVPGSVFAEKYLQPFLTRGAPTWIFNLGASETETLVSLFNEAFRACEKEPAGYEFIVREKLAQIILRLQKPEEMSTVRRESLQEQRLKQMLDWIEVNCNRKVTVDQIAAAAGICARECQRTFAAVLHQSPISYLLQRRITLAATLLKTGQVDLGEVGARCGFENQSYFTKKFRLNIGMTPGQYRKRFVK